MCLQVGNTPSSTSFWLSVYADPAPDPAPKAIEAARAGDPPTFEEAHR